MRKRLGLLFALILFVCFTSIGGPTASAQDYPALEGLDTVKAVFDFRDGDPANALVHLKLVHITYQSKAIRAVDSEPEFVVVFMDSSVKLLTSERKGFSEKENQNIQEMHKLIPRMVKDGIKLEVCLFAAEYFKIDPKTFPSEIIQVQNGWVSAVGWQAHGYSVVPAY